MKTTLRMPKLGANDDIVQIDRWLVSEGDYVKKGQAIVIVETAKTLVDIEAEQSGYIAIVVAVGDEVDSGGIYAHLYDELSHIGHDEAEQSRLESEPASPSPLMLSDKAKQKVEQAGIDIDGLTGLVSSRVLAERYSTASASRRDNAAAMNREVFPNANVEGIPSAKRTEIKQLSESTANQFSSSLTIQIDSISIKEKTKYVIGTNQNIFSFIMSIYARLLNRYPKFTAYYHDGTINYYNRVNLGVLVDFGMGLNVVVIKDADQLSTKQLHEQIVYGICKYQEGTLTAEDVAHATTTVSDLSADNVYSFQPLINHRQSTILGIGADNTAANNPMTFTLVFDHRVLAGREVSIFLNEFRTALLQGNKQNALSTAQRRQI